MLPEAIREHVTDVARRMACPVEMMAVAVLVVLSSLVGRRCLVCPKQKDNWTEPANLWGLIIARPSEKKTPVLNAATEPLRKLEARAHDQHNTETAGKRFYINDSTVEKLIEIARDNPQGFALIRDEIQGLFRQWSKKGHESDRTFYLEAWSGNRDYTTDRIGRGTVRAAYVCLSLLGTIQRGPLEQYIRDAVSGGLGDDGLVARFQLMIYPDGTPYVHVDEHPNEDAQARYFTVCERLDRMGREHVVCPGLEPDESPYLRFDPKAQDIATAWICEHEKRLQQSSDDDALISHFGKYRSLFPKLALIFELTEWAAGPEHGQLRAISPSSAKLAARWCAFLEQHARRVYALATMGEESPASVLAHKIKRGALGREFTASDVRRKHWARLQDRAVDDALKRLTEWGWLRCARIPTGGRPKEQYEVNPALLSEGRS